jgi:HNH endonuclease
MTQEDRFWARVKRGDADECWLWQRAPGSHGYGQLRFNKQANTAHRVSWTIAHGDPSDLCVLHKCDVRLCVNPAHLFLGTRKDNNADARAKGRATQKPWLYADNQGEKNGQAKITADVAREIHRRALSGENQKAIGAAFGVTSRLVSLIKRGKRWRHATEAA